MLGQGRSGNERSFPIKSGQDHIRVGQDMSSQIR